MKVGRVVLLGRPNAGKSTLVNSLVGTKVAITSPAPQTTRSLIRAVLTEERGQIVLVDTPGIFAKVKGLAGKKINLRAIEAFGESDGLLYLVDQTRERGFEENKVLGWARKFKGFKVLAINKIDVDKFSFRAEYRFLESEFDRVVEISALKRTHLKTLKSVLFELLPERKDYLYDPKLMVYPAVGLSAKEFLTDLIREKAFLNLRQEAPYSMTVVVNEVQEKARSAGDRPDSQLKTIYIKARILTLSDHYKKMIIGQGGRMVRQIGFEARKELELATGKKVFLDLEVETDRHWVERYL